MTEPAGHTREMAAARLRAAIEMFETGVEMKRQALRRAHPGLTDLEIDARLRAWLAVTSGRAVRRCGRPACELAPPFRVNGLEAVLRSAALDLADLGLRWALVGGLAVSARADPRFTRDVDLVIAIRDDHSVEQ